MRGREGAITALPLEEHQTASTERTRRRRSLKGSGPGLQKARPGATLIFLEDVLKYDNLNEPGQRVDLHRRSSYISGGLELRKQQDRNSGGISNLTRPQREDRCFRRSAVEMGHLRRFNECYDCKNGFSRAHRSSSVASPTYPREDTAKAKLAGWGGGASRRHTTATAFLLRSEKYDCRANLREYTSD